MSEIKRKLRGCMTVEQVIEALKDYPSDAIVLFSCDYGDHSHTQQALPVTEVGSLEQRGQWLTESPYSQSGLAVEDEDEDPDDDEMGGTTVVVLK